MISVIIPYFNKIGTLDRAVNSVIEQEYANWELIIIDDCSEQPISIREQWQRYRIIVFRNDTNIGPGPTRQRGMALAKGEFIAFLDADDWWSKDFLKVCYEKLNENPNASAAWARSQVYHKDGSISIRKYSEIPFTQLQETSLQYPRPWQTGSLLWRRMYCGEWGSLSTNQDYQFEFSSSLKSNTVVPVGKILYHVDQRTGNHRTDLVKHNEVVQNQFELYKYVYYSLRPILSKKSKILLFHRIIRSIIKVTEHGSSEKVDYYWRQFR